MSSNGTIAILAHSHPAFSKGGGEIVAYNSFNGFRNDGRKAIFIAGINSHLYKTSSIFLEDELIVEIAPGEYVFQAHEFDGFSQVHRDRRFFQSVIDLLRRHDVEVAHLHHYWNVGFDLVAMLRAQMPGLVTALTLHEFQGICFRDGQMLKRASNALCTKASDTECAICFPEHHREAFRARREFILNHLSRFDVLTAPSEFLAQRYGAWGVEKDIYVVENGYDPDGAPEPGLLEQPDKLVRRFAFFGQPTPFKGVDLFVAAALRLLQQGQTNLTFTVYGCTRNRFLEMVGQDWARALDQFRANLVFFGPYDVGNVLALMRENGWIVVPSIWWENSPLVIQEAFLAGRPPIVADIGGMREKVAHGRTGLHFRARDPSSLAATFEAAARNVRDWSALRAAIVPPPTIKHVNDFFAQLYRASRRRVGVRNPPEPRQPKALRRETSHRRGLMQ